MPRGPLIAPSAISALTRSRERLGATAVSARSNRSPAASEAIHTRMIDTPDHSVAMWR